MKRNAELVLHLLDVQINFLPILFSLIPKSILNWNIQRPSWMDERWHEQRFYRATCNLTSKKQMYTWWPLIRSLPGAVFFLRFSSKRKVAEVICGLGEDATTHTCRNWYKRKVTLTDRGLASAKIKKCQGETAAASSQLRQEELAVWNCWIRAGETFRWQEKPWLHKRKQEINLYS